MCFVLMQNMHGNMWNLSQYVAYACIAYATYAAYMCSKNYKTECKNYFTDFGTGENAKNY